jgi:hypothetical protein
MGRKEFVGAAQLKRSHALAIEFEQAGPAAESLASALAPHLLTLDVPQGACLR